MGKTKNPRINSLGILKIICFLLMFWHHSYLPKPSVDLGARACEFFFVASGFLVAYNHADSSDSCSWKESYLYLKKKMFIHDFFDKNGHIKLRKLGT